MRWFCWLALAALTTQATAQQLDPRLFQEMRWRSIGPFRGGRTKAAAGIADQPCTFFIGVVNGGVWRTSDCGRVWTPIFDDQPTGSIGAIALAPSDPEVIYVGSGEGLQRPDLSTGDGIYRSRDGGKEWTHLGLRDGQQIPQIVVDPRDADRLYVAVLGHPYGPNEERGLFRSDDGGQSFRKVLYRDQNTGAADVVLDPRNPDIVYAVLWEARQAPWENGTFSGPGSGLYKSTDGGATWRQLAAGLPTFADGLGRIGITVAPSAPDRLYATVEVGGSGFIYRSDDAGATWRRTSEDPRPAGRPSDFAEVKVDPTNPDIVYSGSVVTWKSTDGGATWTGFRGAPGGDDYHRIWINPKNPRIILLASDQGAIVTVNGGESWSSWYNQPTAQFYHVSTDNAWPYRVCGGQQESGSACVKSRSDHGAISFRDWSPVGVEEYGYVAADPLDPDIVFGGKVSRFDRRTGQTRQVAPRPFRGGDYRVLRTAPVLFSPIDPRLLYFASNTVWATRDGGDSWTEISPDLTRRDSVVPANVGGYGMSPAARSRHPGVVYTVAPSYRSRSIIWAGSDDGLIHVTMNSGGTWRDATPPDLRPWAKVSLIEAGRFDSLTAYAAINTFRLDDLRPHIYRTHDGGRTWRHITAGIPDGGIVNAVREDPVRRGLLYAGTEQAVYVSFDDGEHWQPLRLNMPATSIRDLVVKDDDLVVGTHGRGFWILDDLTPLRQISAATVNAPAVLFQPQVATRVRWNLNTDTPLPPDEPVGENPPDGAIINYWLGSSPGGTVMLEILDSTGALVRAYSSGDTPEAPLEGRNIPDYWLRPPQAVSSAPGMHRLTWDLRYPVPPGLRRGYPIAAIHRNTALEPGGPAVLPGRYTVRLTVGGRSHQQPLMVRMDPRVKARAADLQEKHATERQLASWLTWLDSALTAARVASRQAEVQSLTRLGGEINTLYGLLDDADAAPTAVVRRELGRLETVVRSLQGAR
jgi:photosystem II stability/assembly factor-like uncharacterized protein